ncbi:hypothetical protein QR680_006690 [Steinernema hermaphroditum]|uniref:glutathione transferase n=2 Tax=Steinernema hermaphroditum TaxID=289476 RepID=A0AA39LXT8_9BILA|nr:hypothetical protein QR680_006690 [Steinernema hermaphroditum]
MTVYKLHYFENLGARAELIRLLLVYGELPYEEVSISRAEWSNLKANYPNNQLPVLEMDGKMLPQSIAIARFLAKKVGLLGEDDWEAAQTDAFIDLIEDTIFALETKGLAMKMVFGQGNEVADEVVTTLKPFLERLEKHLHTTNGQNLVGNHLTWADLGIADWFRRYAISAPHLLDEFLAVKKFTDYVYGLPKIKKMDLMEAYLAVHELWIFKVVAAYWLYFPLFVCVEYALYLHMPWWIGVWRPQEMKGSIPLIYITKRFYSGDTVERGDIVLSLRDFDPKIDFPWFHMLRVVGLPRDWIYNDITEKYDYVPDGHLYLMGDRRHYGVDSRRMGPFAFSDIHEKIVYGFFPFSSRFPSPINDEKRMACYPNDGPVFIKNRHSDRPFSRSLRRIQQEMREESISVLKY